MKRMKRFITSSGRETLAIIHAYKVNLCIIYDVICFYRLQEKNNISITSIIIQKQTNKQQDTRAEIRKQAS